MIICNGAGLIVKKFSAVYQTVVRHSYSEMNQCGAVEGCELRGYLKQAEGKSRFRAAA